MKLLRTSVLTCCALWILGAGAAHAEPEAEPCRGEVDTISLFTAESHPIDADPGKRFDEKVASLRKKAKELELEDFKILSQNMTVSTSYDGSSLDFQFGFSLAFRANSSAHAAWLNEAGILNYTVNRNEVARCPAAEGETAAATIPVPEQ